MGEDCVDVIAVANTMLEESGFNLCNLKLQKLLYFVYGATLCLNDVAIGEPPQAWKYGPVFPTVYSAYRKYGADVIEKAVTPRRRDSKLKNAKLREIVAMVFHAYGFLPGYRLVMITHTKNSPWGQVYDPDSPYPTNIPDHLIKNYFKEHVIKSKRAA